MKKGISLTDLAQEIERHSKSKRDFVVNSQLLDIITDSGDLALAIYGNDLESRDPNKDPVELFRVNDNFHAQMASRLCVPKTYYDLCRKEAPHLLAYNVNHWLSTSKDKRLVRTLDGTARAFLSDRYRRLDNFDLLKAVLPVLQEQTDLQIESCNVTETRMYLKAVFPKIQGEVKKGDVVQAGLVISNSEVGSGSLRVEPLVYRLVCLNGMISQYAMRKYHVGANQKGNGGADDFFEMLTDETKQVSDQAFWMQVRDLVRLSIKEDIFETQVKRLREAQQSQPITGEIVKVVELSQKRFGFTDEEGSGILQHLIKGGDLSAYGLANAVTRTSQDVDNYDRATELERVGGKIIELSRNDWDLIAEAA